MHQQFAFQSSFSPSSSPHFFNVFFLFECLKLSKHKGWTKQKFLKGKRKKLKLKWQNKRNNSMCFVLWRFVFVFGWAFVGVRINVYVFFSIYNWKIKKTFWNGDSFLISCHVEIIHFGWPIRRSLMSVLTERLIPLSISMFNLQFTWNQLNFFCFFLFQPIWFQNF